MKILITGGAGFIGSSLVLRLVAEGHEVIVIDSLSRQIHGSDPEQSPLYMTIKDKCTFIHESVENINNWQTYLEGVEAVVNLAAETGTGQSMYDIANYSRVNSMATSNLVDSVVNGNHSVKKVIVASSRSVYGEGAYSCDKHNAPSIVERNVADLERGVFDLRCPICGSIMEPIATPENMPNNPRSIYAITKLNQEQITMIGCGSVGIDAIALRFQNVYGPGQSLKNPYTGILSIFSNLILSNQKINVFEDGIESRDFVYIDDVVQSIYLSIFSNKGVSGVFNIGSGVKTSVLDVIKNLGDNYELDVDYEISGNYRVGDIRHNFADLSKARATLGFEPTVSFEDGIKKFCKWVVTQKIELCNYEESLSKLKDMGLFK